jgi:hypothetical protein
MLGAIRLTDTRGDERIQDGMFSYVLLEKLTSGSSIASSSQVGGYSVLGLLARRSVRRCRFRPSVDCSRVHSKNAFVEAILAAIGAGHPTPDKRQDRCFPRAFR